MRLAKARFRSRAEGASFRALLLCLSLLLPSVASGYKVMTASQTGVELRWTSQPMKFNIHQTAAPGMTAAATQDAVRKAYLAWTSVSCTAFKTQDLGLVNLPWGDKEDYLNTHVWTSSWPPSYGQNALGITWTSYDPQSGKILDADTHYNPGYTWSNTGSSTAIDAQSVATHEIGHQLGLDHSPIQTATMFYATGQGDSSQRSLDADDMKGVCYLYPSGQPLPPECTTSAQCASSETCQNQKCVPGNQKGYGSTCESGKDCTSGICLEYNNSTFCSQGCDSAACPNGDKCFPVTGGGGISNACLPGSAAQGTKTLGQACTANPDCKTEICVSVPGKGYLCSQKCDVAKQDCPPSFTCATASSGGLCIPASTTPPPPPPPTKKKLGETCSESSECESAICAAIGSGKACVQLCEVGKAGSCPAGFDCLPAGAKGACVKAGPPPPPPPQKGALGAECQKSEDCEKNLCASDAAGKLFCTELCDPAQGCPGEFDCVAAGAQFACSPRPTEQPLEEDGGGCGLARARGLGGPTATAAPERWILILLLPLLILALPRRHRGD